ncbi:MAG: ATP-binding protein [Gammaproteobacteria bacterium]
MGQYASHHYGYLDALSCGGPPENGNNINLLRILEDLSPLGERRAICENRGSGVGAMLEALRRSGLPAALFEDRISAFRVTFSNALRRSKRDRRDDIKALLSNSLCREQKSVRHPVSAKYPSVNGWLPCVSKARSQPPRPKPNPRTSDID